MSKTINSSPKYVLANGWLCGKFEVGDCKSISPDVNLKLADRGFTSAYRTEMWRTFTHQDSSKRQNYRYSKLKNARERTHLCSPFNHTRVGLVSNVTTKHSA